MSTSFLKEFLPDRDLLNGIAFKGYQFDANSYQQVIEVFGAALPERLKNAVPKRKAEYLLGRHCARQILLEHFGQTVQGSLESEEKSIPEWPEGYTGSISHTKSFVCAIVAPFRMHSQLGIDAESWIESGKTKTLQGRICNADELQLFDQMRKTVRSPLTLIFSAKESIYKLLYPTYKKFFGFEAATLVQFDQKQLLFRVDEKIHPSQTLIAIRYQQLEWGVLTIASLPPLSI